jgi:hypothetical protein
LSKVYKTDDLETVVLSDVSLNIEEGNLWQLWGRPDQENPQCISGSPDLPTSDITDGQNMKNL